MRVLVLEDDVHDLVCHETKVFASIEAFKAHSIEQGWDLEDDDTPLMLAALAEGKPFAGAGYSIGWCDVIGA